MEWSIPTNFSNWSYLLLVSKIRTPKNMYILEKNVRNNDNGTKFVHWKFFVRSPRGARLRVAAKKWTKRVRIIVAYHSGSMKARNTVNVSRKDGEYIGGFRRHEYSEFGTVMSCLVKRTVHTTRTPAVTVRGHVACLKMEGNKVATMALWQVNLLLVRPINAELGHASDGMLGHFLESKKFW